MRFNNYNSVRLFICLICFISSFLYGQNTAPDVTNIPGETILEDGNFATISLDNYVSDDQTTDALISWQATGQSSLTVNIVNRIATITAPSDWNGSETITFTATDDDGTNPLSASDAATFAVTAVNDAPVVTDIPDETIAEGGTFTTISLNDYVSDTETADDDIVWTFSGNSNLTVSITSQVASITTPTDWNGNETITFTATDTGDGSDAAESDSDTATVTVTAVNDAPEALDDTASGDEDNDISGDVSLNDSDLDATNGDDTPAEHYALHYAVNTDPSNGSVVMDDDGSYIYTPVEHWNGTDSFTYMVSDEASGSDIATVTLTVNAVNDSPVNTELPVISGDMHVLQTLSTTNGTWNDIKDTNFGGNSNITYEYQWQHADDQSGNNLTNITNADNSVFTITSNEK